MDDPRGDLPSTDGSPDILEVFGAQPLVSDHADASEAEDDDPGSTALFARLDALERSLSEMARQAAFLPPKLRRIGDRVDSLGRTLAHDRCRDLLSELCLLDDVVQNGIRGQDDGDPHAALRTLVAVANQLRSLFERQGLSEIATDGRFDPHRHQAVRSLPVDDPAFAGTVLEVDRRGFSADGQVLRFAEVAVGRFVGDTEDGQASDDPSLQTDPDQAREDADDDGPLDEPDDLPPISI